MWKSYFLCVALFFIAVFSVFADNESALEGYWKRSDGTPYDGAVIHISLNKKSYEGKIVKLSDGLTKDGYKTGDIKWNNIKANDDFYEIGDLIARSDHLLGIIQLRTYGPAALLLNKDDRNELYLIKDTDILLKAGTISLTPGLNFQRYVRVSGIDG